MRKKELIHPVELGEDVTVKVVVPIFWTAKPLHQCQLYEYSRWINAIYEFGMENNERHTFSIRQQRFSLVDLYTRHTGFFRFTRNDIWSSKSKYG